ncbi:MAG: hypothetical protein QW165_02430 [Candidatus Woesearchaeota archaeon]
MNKLIVWIIVFALIINPALALSSVYESASVSRIVGDSPNEMLKQLKRNDLNLQSAGLFDSSLSPAVYALLYNSFPQSYAQNPANNWLQNSGKTLLVYNSQSPENTHTSNTFITTSSLPPIPNPESLAVVNTQYAGMALPKIDAFGDRLSAKATLIAPLSYSSTRFLEALLCNIGRNGGLPIGETFRLARNNYHWNTQDNSEIIGLGLLSYALYGNPFAEAKVAKFDNPARNAHCKNRLADFTVSTLASSQIISTPEGYQQTHTFGIQDYTIEQVYNYEIINSTDFELLYEPGEMVLPYKSLIFQFPLKTIITGYDVVFSDPVDIIADIPDWTGENYTSRTCNSKEQNQSATLDQVHSSDAQLVIAKINPVAVTDCEQGQFTLHKTVTITLTYYPYSPIRITGIDAPQEALPSEVKTIKVSIENTQNTPTTGTLVLKKNQEIISVKNISTTQSQHTLELYTPAEEGKYAYTIEFVQNNDAKTSTTFSTDVTILQARLEIPEGVEDSAEIKTYISNKMPSSISSTVTAHLIKKGQIISQESKNVQLGPGENLVSFEFTGLQKTEQQYDVLVTIPYENKIKTMAGILFTNHPPAIRNTNMIFKEGDIIKIDPIASDEDGDALTIAIVRQPFALDGSHTLDYDSSGEYTYTVEASDGTATVQQTFGILVQNTNRAPVLTTPERINGKENQTIIIQATATDQDNENTVDNDDNNVSITYGYPFDENGTYTPSYDESGEFDIIITASDGELSDSKIVRISIENVNRPPNLDDLTDITIKEGESIDLWKGSDPDNENEVSDDDNTLQFYFSGGPDGGPIDHFGRWQTDYEDSGAYPITVQVEDGELKAGKAITVTVLNVNRPPVISAPDVVHASGSVDLSQYVTDPDNINSVANDDNALTITYTSPFDSSGKWTPSQPDSAAQATITVSDGEFTVSKTIMVMVDVVGVQPAQSPPVPPEAPEANHENTSPPATTGTSAEQTTQQKSSADANDTEPPAQTTQTGTDQAPQTDSTQFQTQQQTSTPEGAQTINQQANQNDAQNVQTGGVILPAEQNKEEQIPELEVGITVAGKKVINGESVKVKPDDGFSVKIDLKNNAAVEKEIEVDVGIPDLDQEDGDSATIAPGDEERLTFEFEIPRLTDDDEYPLEISVNELEYEITLKIEKPSHEINIRSLTIEPETVPCEQTSAKLGIKIENTGKDDEEGKIKVESSTLNLLDEWPFDLPQGEVQRFEKTINALVTGSHYILVTALYGSRKAEASKQVTVEECVQQETTSMQIAPDERIALALTNKQAAVPVTAETSTEKTMTIVFLVLTAIFSLLILAFAVPRILR